MSGNHTVTVHISYSFSVVCTYFRNLHVTFLCSVCVFIPFYFCSIPEVDPNFRAWLQISSLSQTYSQFTPSLKAAEIAGITECR